jgi:tetratricopeptide (TPR) repeat protein
MAAKISLDLTGCSSLKRFADLQTSISYDRFYQLIGSGLVGEVQSQQALHDVGGRLVRLAEHLYAFRQLDALDQVSQLLLNLRSIEYETIGRYYQTLCVQRFGLGDIEQATCSLERIAESGPPNYRARAMQSLATNLCYKDDFRSALSLYREVARFASRSSIYDAYATLGSQKMAAVIKGLEGNHLGAVALLENLFPLAQSVRSSQAHIYYDYLNSLAVELCEVGRLEEARNISRVVLVSRFAPAYPEWQETSEEIKLKDRRASRSFVEVGVQKAAGNRQMAESEEVVEADNVIALSTARREAPAAPRAHEPKTRARVIKFPSSTSWTQEELSEKQMIVADMLWDMFQATIHDAPVDLGLIERLYKVFLDARKPA